MFNYDLLFKMLNYWVYNLQDNYLIILILFYQDVFSFLFKLNNVLNVVSQYNLLHKHQSIIKEYHNLYNLNPKLLGKY